MKRIDYFLLDTFSWEVSRQFIAESTFHGLCQAHPFGLDAAWEDVWKVIKDLVRFV